MRDKGMTAEAICDALNTEVLTARGDALVASGVAARGARLQDDLQWTPGRPVTAA
jgi:hypothetical protein